MDMSFSIYSITLHMRYCTSNLIFDESAMLRTLPLHSHYTTALSLMNETATQPSSGLKVSLPGSGSLSLALLSLDNPAFAACN